jgi:Protein of unknown function (DUF1091)
MQRKRKRHIMALPKFNYCDLYGGLVQFDILKTLFLQLQKYGNMTSPCPMEAGNYYLKNLQIDDSEFGALISAFPAGKYFSTIEITDDYGPKGISLANVEISLALSKT